MNYYSFHIGHYAAHTRYLNLIEDLAYRRMLDMYYGTEKPLPLEPEKIAREVGKPGGRPRKTQRVPEKTLQVFL